MIAIERRQIYSYFHDNAIQLISTYLPRDRQGKGWVCPLCGNGSGSDGDGIVYNSQAKEPGHFHCFKCGFDGDLIDLIGEEFNIVDHIEKQNKACEMLGIEIGSRDSHLESNTRNKTSSIPEHREKSTQTNPDRKDRILKALKESLAEVKGDFSDLFEKAHALLNCSEALDYIHSRGITDTNKFLKCMGYLENTYVGDVFFRSGITFHSSNASYAIRDTNPNADSSKKSRKPSGAVDIPIGLLEVIRERDKTFEKTAILEPVFVVEGLFDAPSIAEAGADAIALNGVGNIWPVIWAFKEFEIKRPILLLMDTDKSGEQAQGTNREKLEKAGIKVYDVTLSSDENYKDANEFLVASREDFIERIQQLRKFPIQEFESTFNKSKKQAFIKQLSDRANRLGIKTGFKVLDSEDFLDGGLHPGLYVVGAISSLGKTTFALQLADQIAASGQDVIFFTLEMPEMEIMGKSVSRYTFENLLNNHRFKPGDKPGSAAKSLYDVYRGYNEDSNGVIHAAIEKYFQDTGDHLRIIEGLGNVDAETIREILEQHLQYTGNKPIIFIDYLQLLIQPKDEDGKRKNATDKQIIDANIFRLKQISRDYEVPIFGISSFNRDSYSETVSMKSFKESGAIEYSSDVLIGLEPAYMSVDGRGKNASSREKAKQQYKNAEKKRGFRKIRLVILKNRNGRAGEVDTFYYYPQFNCYIELGEETALDNFARPIIFGECHI